VSGFSRTQQPTFRTGANYIRVDVYPTKDGKPIDDLIQDDFEILDEKVPQKIEQFERVVIRTASQEEHVDPTSVRDMRQQLESTRGRVFVIFLDTGHVTVDGSFRMRQPLINALDTMIGADDLVAVMTPAMSPTELTFARKVQSIETFLTKRWNWGEAGDGFHTPITDPVEHLYETCYGFVDDPKSDVTRAMITRRREHFTIEAMRDLMVWLRGVREERKAIVFVSNGFEVFGPNPSLEGPPPPTPQAGFDPRTGKLSSIGDPATSTLARCDRDRKELARMDDRPEFRGLLDLANAANASIYPISPAGLWVNMSGVVRAPTTPSNNRLELPLFADEPRNELLMVLADNTDGLAIVNTNDLAGGMKRIVSDLTSYYLLGYYTNRQLDGRFHPITVRVKKPGVAVRARRGYLAARPSEAAPAPAKAEPSAEARAIETALSPLTAIRDAPLRLQTVTGWKPGGGAAIWVVGELSGDDWRLGAEGDLMTIDARGSTLGTVHVSVPVGARVFRAAIAPASLAEGAYTITARLHSPNATATETTQAILAASPGAAGAVFVRRGPTTANKDVLTSDRRFRRSEQVRVEIPVVEAAAASVRLLDRSGKPLTIPVVAGVREDADGSKWQTAQVALAPLAPGDYLIELSPPVASGLSRTLQAFRIVP
jgi:VWFA-related protein